MFPLQVSVANSLFKNIFLFKFNFRIYLFNFCFKFFVLTLDSLYFLINNWFWTLFICCCCWRRTKYDSFGSDWLFFRFDNGKTLNREYSVYSQENLEFDNNSRARAKKRWHFKKLAINFNSSWKFYTEYIFYNSHMRNQAFNWLFQSHFIHKQNDLGICDVYVQSKLACSFHFIGYRHLSYFV